MTSTDDTSAEPTDTADTADTAASAASAAEQTTAAAQTGDDGDVPSHPLDDTRDDKPAPTETSETELGSHTHVYGAGSVCLVPDCERQKPTWLANSEAVAAPQRVRGVNSGARWFLLFAAGAVVAGVVSQGIHPGSGSPTTDHTIPVTVTVAPTDSPTASPTGTPTDPDGRRTSSRSATPTRTVSR